MKEQDLKNAVKNIKISDEAKIRILKQAKNYRKEGKVMKARKIMRLDKDTFTNSIKSRFLGNKQITMYPKFHNLQRILAIEYSFFIPKIKYKS